MLLEEEKPLRRNCIPEKSNCLNTKAFITRWKGIASKI